MKSIKPVESMNKVSSIKRPDLGQGSISSTLTRFISSSLMPDMGQEGISLSLTPDLGQASLPSSLTRVISSSLTGLFTFVTSVKLQR